MPGVPTSLVTGGAGFLGTAVTEALEADGYAVTVLGRSSQTEPLTGATIATALARDPALVVHCAGGSSVARSIQDPDGERAKTVPPFAELLGQLRDRAPVVLLSSAAVYGAAAVVPTPETSPTAPLSPYGEHKLACEQLVRAHGGPAAIVQTRRRTGGEPESLGPSPVSRLYCSAFDRRTC